MLNNFFLIKNDVFTIYLKNRKGDESAFGEVYQNTDSSSNLQSADLNKLNLAWFSLRLERNFANGQEWSEVVNFINVIFLLLVLQVSTIHVEAVSQKLKKERKKTRKSNTSTTTTKYIRRKEINLFANSSDNISRKKTNSYVSFLNTLPTNNAVINPLKVNVK